MERRGVRVAAVAVALLVLGGCAGDSRSPEEPAPSIELSFTQLLPEEGTNRALLRVINHEPRAITVTAVGLDWPGYGAAREETGEKVVPLDSELMLRLELPQPVCTTHGRAPDDAVRGVVRVDGHDLTQPLTGPAQDYVRRLWRTQCDQELLDRSLRVAYAGDHEQSAGPGADLVRTSLVLTRVSGDQPVRVVSPRGSVLYDVRLTGRTSLPRDAESVRVGLEILPGNRCDEHAIGQATAPYDFSIVLRVGSRGIRHAISPPLPIQNAASEMLLRHCGSLRR